MNTFLIAVAIFSICYVTIISERLHRTVVAMVGGVLMVLFGVLSQESAIEFIDFNTIGLLVGMMIIVHLLSKTGIFQYLGIVLAQKSKGNPIKIMLSMSLLTMISSALLDNVTTVLLLTPILLVIAFKLKITPLPFLFSEIMVANIAGAATLIGDPTSIIIGSASGLTFVDFLLYNGPVVVLIYLANVLALKIIYKKQLKSSSVDFEKVFADLDPKESITDTSLLKKALVVMALVIAAFSVHGLLHIEPATIAIAGAGLLLMLTNLDPAHSLEAVEWNVIFFFAGLFVLVGGLEHVGVIEKLASILLDVTNGNQISATFFILWGAGVFSSIIDNIPFVATMTPLLNDLTVATSPEFVFPLWWALSLGACLGGNGTLVGASANLVVTGIAEKQGKIKIGFLEYMKVAFPLMLMSLVIASGYMYIRFF